MLPSITLQFPRDPEDAHSLKILAAAAITDVPLQMDHPTDASNKALGNLTFLPAGDPRGEYPLLRIEDRGLPKGETTLFDANAILRYVARLGERGDHHLYGRTPFEASQVDQWIDFSANHLDASNMPYIRAVFYEKRGSTTVPKAVNAAIERVLSALEEALTIRTFLVGERLSIADIAVAFSMHWVYRCNHQHSYQYAMQYKSVYRHYMTVMAHPKIKVVLSREKALVGPLRSC